MSIGARYDPPDMWDPDDEDEDVEDEDEGDEEDDDDEDEEEDGGWQVSRPVIG